MEKVEDKMTQKQQETINKLRKEIKDIKIIRKGLRIEINQLDKRLEDIVRGLEHKIRRLINEVFRKDERIIMLERKLEFYKKYNQQTKQTVQTGSGDVLNKGLKRSGRSVKVKTADLKLTKRRER